MGGLQGSPHLAAQTLLCLAQGFFVLFEAGERSEKRAIRKGGKAGNTQINADRSLLSAGMNRFRNFPFRLDGDEPPVAGQVHRDVLYFALNFPALAVAQPAQFGQENPAVRLIQMNLFGIWVAEVVAAPPFLEARWLCPPRKAVRPGPFQILERLLQSLSWRSLLSHRFCNKKSE